MSVEKLTMEEFKRNRRLVEVSGFFDEQWYSDRYPELVGQDLLDHYMNYGAYEGRSPGPLFDAEYYVNSNPDLRNGVREGMVNPVVHFIVHGADEGRHAAPPEPV